MVTEIKPDAPALLAHPLDPLSTEEIERASALAKARAGGADSIRFPLVALAEPDKRAVRSFTTGDAIERRALAIVFDTANGETAEAVVDLNADAVISWTPRDDVQPFPLMEEFGRAQETIKNDPEWRAAMARKGVTEEQLKTIQIDPWPAGNFGSKWETGHRILKGIAYLRDTESDNGYGRPVDGVMAVVDLIENRVLEVVEEDAPPPPTSALRFDGEHAAAHPRQDLKQLDIVQPEGASFTLDGHLLKWQKWQMRVSLHPREGLVLHQIAYEDDGRLRPICYRASMAEMVVPYGDPSITQSFKNAFDSGEVGGLGRLTNSLELGCDCLGEIVYMDGHVTDERGGARTIKNAVCIHEEDFGILWKHTYADENGQQSWVRRSRRLVVSAIATVGNYDYGFYWYFYQDGSWEQEVKATGIVQTISMADDDPQITRHRIAPGLGGTIHQHFLCFRLDMEVDGAANSVYEIDTVPLPRSAEYPLGNAFTARATLLGRESEAARSVNSASARHWRIANDAARNPLGEPPAYILAPGETVGMMADEQSAVGQRAVFARNQLHVTPYAAAEFYPAGDYPNQSEPGQGIPAWMAADRALQDEDLVVWYTVGMNHLVCPEDWPVAPVHRAGFNLKPWGFFDRNPALDVPMPDHCAHDEESHAHDNHSRNGHS